MAARKNKGTKTAQGINAEAQALCDQLGVNRLWRNSRGEYFTERTYALASEGGDKKKVSLYEASASMAEIKEEADTKEDAMAADAGNSENEGTKVDDDKPQE